MKEQRQSNPSVALVDFMDMIDAERLRTLEDYDILDTPSEPEFDDIVFLASTVCRTPVALVSLVGRDRQWFKARFGFEECETPIAQSVCRHALHRPDLLIIPDLTSDPRTSDNPLVAGGPKIRFYAGAPLVAPNGAIVGTLCVIDQTPRPHGLDETQEKALKALARQVVMLMEARRQSHHKDRLFRHQKYVSATLRALAETNAAAQEAGRFGTFEIDVNTSQMKVSAEFCRIFDIPFKSSYPAASIEAMILPEDRPNASSSDTRLAQTLELSVEYRIVTQRHGIRWIARDARFIDDGMAQSRKMVGTVQDITDLKRAEADQDVVNRELSHRLKNTLATVQAIASQTLRGIADRDRVAAFEKRLMALGTAHDILLQKNWSGASLIQLVTSSIDKIAPLDRFDISGPDTTVGPKGALSISMILHELATNALKYGSLSTSEGRVAVSWTVEGSSDEARFSLTWAEWGGPAVEQPPQVGFGSKLIRMGIIGTGAVALNYAPTGLVVEMSAPFFQLQQAE